MLLSTMAYSQHADQDLVQTLLALATVPEFRNIVPPVYDSFRLARGRQPDRDRLLAVARANVHPFESCPESLLAFLPSETVEQADERREEQYQAAVQQQLNVFVDSLVAQWPCPRVSKPQGAQLSTYIGIDKATEHAQEHFEDWYRNEEFWRYVNRLQDILNGLMPNQLGVSDYSFSLPAYSCTSQRTHVELKSLLLASAPKLPSASNMSSDRWTFPSPETPQAKARLETLLDRLFSAFQNAHGQKYVAALQESLAVYQGTSKLELEGPLEVLRQCLEENRDLCASYASDCYRIVLRCLESEDSISVKLAHGAGLWPRLSILSLLQCLARGNAKLLQNDWQATLTGFGVAIAQRQRAERLLACLGSRSELLNELSNAGHQNWDPLDQPEWLLLEIENDLLIRPAQVRIAEEMISPSSGANSLLQLNMGEGKSSVIVPIVAAALADGKKLVRIVVLRTLAPQMFRLLRRRLGGLLGRRIFQMPISRSVRLDASKARELRSLCLECMESGGVLLVQPEHLLSFALMGPERILAGDTELGNTLVDIQRWVDMQSRDVLDESDEILSVKVELVYTMGVQGAIDFSPDRWTVVQHVLGLVRRFASTVYQQFPQGLELRSGAEGCFPRTRLLHSDAADALLRAIARDICDVGLPGLPVWSLPPHKRDTLFNLLVEPDVDAAAVEWIQQDEFAVDSRKKIVLLLRGLIAGGVVASALQHKRWRVQYGLDLTRIALTVPYRAKDSPDARTEFSHPDATIVLTCLSYYYGGLSDIQLRIAFEKLSGCDDT